MLATLFMIIFPAMALENFDYQFKNKNHAFTRDAEAKITISAFCYPLEVKRCDAFNVLKDIKKIDVPEKFLLGGARKGAVLCDRLLKGTIVKGKNAKGGENAFCQFKDKSMIDIGTLGYYHSKKD
jgi:hypothetical protein